MDTPTLAVTAAYLRAGDCIKAGLDGPTLTLRDVWSWEDASTGHKNVSFRSVELYGIVTVNPEVTYTVVRRAS
jgi:hypothetical protein